MPVHTTNWAIRRMLGNAGSWRNSTGATAGEHLSAMCMLCSPLSPTQAGSVLPCPTHGTMQGMLHGYGLELVPQPSCRSEPQQYKVPWQDRTGASPAVPWHSTLSKFLSTHCFPPPCPDPSSHPASSLPPATHSFNT